MKLPAKFLTEIGRTVRPILLICWLLIGEVHTGISYKIEVCFF